MADFYFWHPRHCQVIIKLAKNSSGNIENNFDCSCFQPRARGLLGSNFFRACPRKKKRPRRIWKKSSKASVGIQANTLRSLSLSLSLSLSAGRRGLPRLILVKPKIEQYGKTNNFWGLKTHNKAKSTERQVWNFSWEKIQSQTKYEICTLNFEL